MDLNKFLEGLTSKVRLMVGRAIISALKTDGAVHAAQLRLLAGEVQDNVELMQHYGFTSAPKVGADGAVIFLGGNRDAGIVIATHDRRYRLALQSGEVALHDDQEQVVHLKRDGMELSTPYGITLKAGSQVLVDAPMLACTGEIKDLSAGAGKTMSAMRATYNNHTHNENNVLNSPTQSPNEAM